MKILYGVQGTGNGHITRARAMVEAFAKTHLQVDFLFSGRKASDYFDMQCFGDYQVKTGLTFQVDKGRVNYLKTAMAAPVREFRRDYRSLDVHQYDVILTDFEPITAWAGKQADIPVIGLGHQYVFDFPIPQKKAGTISSWFLRNYAPVKECLAVHWDHFDQPILPPIIEAESAFENRIDSGKVVVYLPFEQQRNIAELFSKLTDFQFSVYSPRPAESGYKHIQFKPLSRDGFLQELHQCDAVIANAGFELSSEALHLGKRLLVKPLSGQVEQHSNAIALNYLKYGRSMMDLDVGIIKDFLTTAKRVQVHYPSVADEIVNWLASGMPERNHTWYEKIWKKVRVNRY
ncbi:MJ1255/VC2487 family glycosyltransferase [Marinicella sp. W31]|uniref:MJ1255/VC2487 family glycosyltransferase n=1 Tax=Marinicella sp. W31 TaxID=3023713 RepID=UPI0037577B39